MSENDLGDAEEERPGHDRPTPLEIIDAPSDLIPGVYEGGLRLWECSLDLVDYLDGMKDGSEYEGFRAKRILEVILIPIHARYH